MPLNLTVSTPSALTEVYNPLYMLVLPSMLLVLNIFFSKYVNEGFVQINPKNYLVDLHPTPSRQTPSHVRISPKFGMRSTVNNHILTCLSDSTLFSI